MTEFLNIVEAKLLMLFYEDGSIDCRNINEGKVSASKPIYEETANRIFGHLNGHFKLKQFRGMIPENVIRVDNVEEIICWYKDAGKMTMKHTNKKNNGVYAHPPLLFLVKKNKIKIFAIKKRSSEALLYQAPFPNIMNNSFLCTGSVEVNFESVSKWENVMEKAENIFFNSRFSHEPEPNQLVGKDQEVYDLKELIPIKKRKVKHEVEKF